LDQKTNNPEKVLDRLMDVAIDDLMATTDEELRGEALEDGVDIDVVAERVRANMLKTAKGQFPSK
jgi:hypothetical protein